MKYELVLLYIIYYFIDTATLTAQIYDDPKYPELLEPNAELYMSGKNYTVEQVNQRKYIFKTYWEDTASIAFYITFDYKDFKTFHGPYVERNRDGSIIDAGNYKLGKRQGAWQKNNVFGVLVDDKKDGIWITKDKFGKVIREDNYENNEMVGFSKIFDKDGNIVETIDSKNTKPRVQEPTFIASFPGCEESNLDSIGYFECSNALLSKFFEKNLKYPPIARNEGIQGTVWMRFTIRKDGSLVNIMPIHPFNPILVQASYDLISSKIGRAHV